MRCGNFESEKPKRFDVWFARKSLQNRKTFAAFKLPIGVREIVSAKIELTFIPAKTAWTTLFQFNKK